MLAQGNMSMRHAPSVLTKSAATEYVIAKESMAYFAVNTRNGFVLVSSDSRMPEVLGYCDYGDFNIDSIPPAMRYWLDCYDEEAQYLFSSDTNSYLKRNASSFRPIEPLLTCKWNQSAPYNNLAPDYNDSGTKSASGCVATAMAQIMYYYRHPQQGFGSNSYLWIASDPIGKYATLSADFGSTTYDWNNMIDTYKTGNYTSEQADAVATLMYHCGVSVNMGYGKSSGAYTNVVPSAMNKYFGYDGNYQRIQKVMYPIDSLNQIIYSELTAARPILVSGQNDEGGHAFVCDGVDNRGYFHINWGWGGSNDGYFLLSALNPSGSQGIGGTTKGYNQYTSFYIGLQPTSETPTKPAIPQMGADSITISAMKLYRNVSFDASIYKLQNFGLTNFTGSYGFALYKEDTDEMVCVLKQQDNYSLTAGYYRTVAATLSGITIPDYIPNGTYNLCAVYKNKDYDWMRLMCTSDEYYRTLTINADSVVFYPNDDPSVLTLTKPIYFANEATEIPKSGSPLYFSVGNEGGTFRGEISARIYKGAFSKGQYELLDDVRISRHQTLETALQQTFDAALLVNTEYVIKLCWRMDDRDQWHDFEPAEYAQVKFTLYDPNPNLQLRQRIAFDDNEIKKGMTDSLRLDISNTGAAFDGYLCPVIYADDERYNLLGEYEILLESNSSNLITLPCKFDDYEIGRYTVYLKYRTFDNVELSDISPIEYSWTYIDVLENEDKGTTSSVESGCYSDEIKTLVNVISLGSVYLYIYQIEDSNGIWYKKEIRLNK